MPALPLVDDRPADPQLAAMFDEVRAKWPAVPNLYRVLGHSPDMLRAWLDLAWPLRTRSRTPRRLRELVILRGARASRTAYEWAHHVPMAREAGVSEAELEALMAERDAETFTQAERAALRLAGEVAKGPGASPDCMAELKRYFQSDEIIELVLTASFYVCVGRVLTSLAVPLEDRFAEPW